MKNDEDEWYEEGKRTRITTETPTFLLCRAANFDHEEGEPILLVALGMNDEIEHLAFTESDARKMIVEMLVGIATLEDKFARRVLQAEFPSNDEGRFFWPEIETDM